ncbi:DUF1643 domain-containing protein [Curtobacterium citreum]|uniref:DUF1643 domain-containing protein n=1 Tax=Curtobacterium citreum TaxID=2036 RepID=UPI0035A92B0F
MIGSNPPRTSGVRTLNRAAKASLILDFDSFSLTNLISVPTHSTGEISALAAEEEAWIQSRSQLVEALSESSGVLLAYGIGAPTGPARHHHADQIAWLQNEIERRSLPTWTVGGQPRHPSRWQRFTHRKYPGIDFDAALSLSLCDGTLHETA